MENAEVVDGIVDFVSVVRFRFVQVVALVVVVGCLYVLRLMWNATDL